MFSLCCFSHSSLVPEQCITLLLKACFRRVMVKILRKCCQWLDAAGLLRPASKRIVFLCCCTTKTQNPQARLFKFVERLGQLRHPVKVHSWLTSGKRMCSTASSRPLQAGCTLEDMLLVMLCHTSQRLLGYCGYQTVSTTFWSKNDAKLC